MKKQKILIVGAGFAGAVCARVLAERGLGVRVIDRRSHIAGNAYDCLDEHGVLIHQYGPHLFHTNSADVFEFLSRFTEWRFYEHRVLAKVEDELYPIPINRTTINALYGLNLSEDEVGAYYERVRIPKQDIKTSEDVVLNGVGEDLCNKFFRGYTRKQWGMDLSELSAGVAARIPTRTNDDDRYFADKYQFMPVHGYTAMFKNMLEHENIEVQLNTDFQSLSSADKDMTVIYTGPIDEYFGCCFGALPYRSLSFEHKHHTDRDFFQSVGTVNYPNDHDYTRISEFKRMTGQECQGTSVVYEYPQAEGDPYYPVPKPENQELYKKYESKALELKNVHFVGRLAQYRYYNMDQVVAAALKTATGIADTFSKK